MNREEKTAVIDEIAAQIEGSEAIFAVNYRGISVPQAAELRAKLPSRDVLNAQFAGVVASPLTGLVRGLGSMIQGLASQLGQIAEKGLVTGEAPAEAAPAAETPAAETPAAEAAADAEEPAAEEAKAEEAEPAAEEAADDAADETSNTDDASKEEE